MNTVQSTLKRVEAPKTKLTILAWAVVLIGSMMPAILLNQFMPGVGEESILPTWLGWTQMIVLAVLAAVSWVWSTIKPLRGLILAMLAFWVGAYFFSPAIRESAAYTNWVSQASWGVALITSPITVHLAPVVLMTLTLIGSGLRRRELFLVRGDPNAPAQPTRIFNIKEPTPWISVARQFMLIYVIILVIVVGLNVKPDFSQFSQALIYLPAIIITSAINALLEEFQYRSVLLARLEPLVKPNHAMFISAVLFMSLHYYTGTPSGPLGAIAVMFLGWVTAKSVLETRELVWAWLLHFIADFVIFFFAAMTI